MERDLLLKVGRICASLELELDDKGLDKEEANEAKRRTKFDGPEGPGERVCSHRLCVNEAGERDLHRLKGAVEANEGRIKGEGEGSGEAKAERFPFAGGCDEEEGEGEEVANTREGRDADWAPFTSWPVH